ncbi:MAG: hypothetical protein ABJA98_19225 [Acidobacteriota bacterium]
MSKKNSAPKAAAATATATTNTRTFLSGLDVVAFYELLDDHLDDLDSGFSRLHAQVYEAELKRLGQDSSNFARLLKSVDAYAGVGMAAKKAGFALGFDVCRQLLLGELDIEALKKDGAR